MKLPWDAKTLRETLKKYQAVLLALAVGLGLLLWPADSGRQTSQTTQQAEDDAGRYVEQLEQRVASALSRMEGVGDATVVLTLSTGKRRELAFDQKGEEREAVVVSAGTGREETVIVQEAAPVLQGALVVCPGGNDPQVRLNILQAVMALTGLRANQISICQGTGGSKG
jgi:stage III sporulation protein AG